MGKKDINKKDGNNKSQHRKNGRVNDGGNIANLEEFLNEKKGTNMGKSKKLPSKVVKIQNGKFRSFNQSNKHNAKTNDCSVIEGFLGMGVPRDEIKPRVNVFTYKIWRSMGRQVMRKSKGVGVTVCYPVGYKTNKNGDKTDNMVIYFDTVFHISQTVPIKPSAKK